MLEPLYTAEEARRAEEGHDVAELMERAGAALAALDAEPELTWMITDDLDQDVVGAQLFGMKTVLLRTGKFRPETLERSSAIPDAVLSSIAHFPDWIDRSL